MIALQKKNMTKQSSNLTPIWQNILNLQPIPEPTEEWMTFHSRMRNSDNRFQGTTKKVLCVCSAGLLRSPTAAQILSAGPFNFNTRSVGIESEHALIVLDKVLINWADDIICFTEDHMNRIHEMIDEMPYGVSARVLLIDCPDDFAYFDPELVKYLTSKFKELYGPK